MSEEDKGFSQAGQIVINSVSVIADKFEPDVPEELDISEEV